MSAVFVAEIPVVSRAEFDRIECNRCGQCCETVGLAGPLELAQTMAGPDADPLVVAWLSDLEPLELAPMRAGDRTIYAYRCLRFARDAEGRGVCTRYDERPPGCRDFPHGAPVRTYERCSYRVRIAGEEG